MLLLLVYVNIASLVVSSPFRLAANITSPHCSAIFGACYIAQTCSSLAAVKVWAFCFYYLLSLADSHRQTLGSYQSAFICTKRVCPGLQGGELLRSKQVSGAEQKLIH